VIDHGGGDRSAAKAAKTVWWYVVILAVLTLFLAFGSWSYQGLIYILAEWQFERFGRYFPTLTIILLVTLAAILLAIGRMVWSRVSAKRQGTPIADDRSKDAQALIRLSLARRFFLSFASFAAIAGLGTFIHYLQLPGPTKEVTTIDLASGAPARLKEGSVVVRGIEPIGPIARASEDIFFSRSSTYLVPVGQTKLENGTSVANLFVQITGTERRSVPAEVRGVLRRNALPSEVAVMYRAAEVPVSLESSVVFLDARTASTPSLNVLMTLIVLTLVGLLFGLLARHRERKFADYLRSKPDQPFE
jgi:NADH:ubiquinone oxidoreductase subunit 6 (subunit J)